MPEFQPGDKAKIVDPDHKYVGKEVIVVSEPIKLEVGTAGITRGGPFLPPTNTKVVYLVEIDGSSSQRIRCEGDCLEPI